MSHLFIIKWHLYLELVCSLGVNFKRFCKSKDYCHYNDSSSKTGAWFIKYNVLVLVLCFIWMPTQFHFILFNRKIWLVVEYFQGVVLIELSIDEFYALTLSIAQIIMTPSVFRFTLQVCLPAGDKNLKKRPCTLKYWTFYFSILIYVTALVTYRSRFSNIWSVYKIDIIKDETTQQ